MADLPTGDSYGTTDALLLPDGRVAVFRWDHRSPEGAGPPVVLYDPTAGQWEPVTLAGEEPDWGSATTFTLAADGRIFSQQHAIEMGDAEWRVASFDMMRGADTWEDRNVAAGADGRIYRSRNGVLPDTTELVAYDATTDTFHVGSPTAGYFPTVHRAGERLVLFGRRDGVDSLIFYDAVADAWSETTALPLSAEWLLLSRAAVASGDVLYVPAAVNEERPHLWAISLATGEAAFIAVPEAMAEVPIDLLWDDAEQQLYSIADHEVWRFTPDS